MKIGQNGNWKIGRGEKRDQTGNNGIPPWSLWQFFS